jgi:hypothetical protein
MDHTILSIYLYQIAHSFVNTNLLKFAGKPANARKNRYLAADSGPHSVSAGRILRCAALRMTRVISTVADDWYKKNGVRTQKCGPRVNC